jgi:hypothetical protein
MLITFHCGLTKQPATRKATLFQFGDGTILHKGGETR